MQHFFLVNMSETYTLRNRRSDGVSSSQERQEVAKPTEEVLVEKLDRFLSSIESRLDTFEQYFRLRASDDDNYEFPEKSSTLRRNSSASLNSLRSFTLPNLSTVHQRLSLIKASVLKSSITNLEHLYNTLDDQYTYLFSSPASEPGSPATETTQLSQSKEILSRKIITTIQYFDEKLSQVDNLIQEKTPQATTDYHAPSFQHFRFYNFNKALQKAEKEYLHYYDIPLSWRENRYIIYGYRFSLSHKTMLKSVFQFNHNESMNIWTHLIGALIVIFLGAVHLPSTELSQINSYRDNVVVYMFLAAAFGCLACSTIWHTYSCFAKLPVRSSCASVDYTGITILISASVISSEYCSLYHFPKLQKIVMTFTILCGLGGLTLNWSSYFDRPECRPLRIGFFVGLAFVGLTTFVAMCFNEGVMVSLKFFLPLVLKSCTAYLAGVVFYGGLIPERWRYDVIINEDGPCHHNHTARDVLTDNIEHSGEEEFQQLETELHEQEDSTNDESNDNLGIKEDPTQSKEYREIIDKHFPDEPTKTVYHKDFWSLYWVDYFFSSHSIWHIFVLLGILGHYFSLLGMFETLHS